MNTGKKRRQAVVEKKDCVACGCCVKGCPKEAITVIGGLFAQVDRGVARTCNTSIVYSSHNASSFSASVIVIVPRESLTIPSF